MSKGQNNRGVMAVFRRELERIKKNPIYWVMMLVIPLISFLFFITLLNAGLPSELPIAVVDHDNSSTSRMVIRQLNSTQQSKVIGQFDDYAAASYAMQQGKIYAFVVIPRDFQADLLGGHQPNVPFYVDNARYIAGSLLMKDITMTLASVSSGVNLKMRIARGESPESAMAQVQPIKPAVSELGNHNVNYSVYLSTTMLPGILQILIMVVTVFAVGTELKHRTSHGWLKVADGSIVKALIGKLLPYTIVFIILALFVNVLLFKYLSFPFHGSWWQMGLGIILFVLAHQSLAVVFIGLIPVMRDSLSVVAIIGTLGISMCGLTFPVEAMPDFAHSWSAVFPMRHYFLIYVSQALTGAGMSASWLSYLVLLLYTILPVAVLVRLKKALIHQNYPAD